jgi:hypothetical protein
MEQRIHGATTRIFGIGSRGSKTQRRSGGATLKEVEITTKLAKARGHRLARLDACDFAAEGQDVPTSGVGSCFPGFLIKYHNRVETPFCQNKLAPVFAPSCMQLHANPYTQNFQPKTCAMFYRPHSPLRGMKL